MAVRPAEHGGETIRVVPDGRVIADDATSAWDMARLGQGIAREPYRLAAADLRSGRIVEVLRDWRRDSSPLTILRREHHSPRQMQAVVGFLRDTLGRHLEGRVAEGG